ncbi:MAG: methylenetetrahydrofolate reductase [Chloroflexi bacterium]|nr:methylenetetrahydrofolate reductase [Chloroflexota bacterium]
MTKVADRAKAEPGRTVFICDFSPPRGADPALLEDAKHLDVDFISVAYNPGKSVRLNSAVAAHWIKANAGKDALFTLATRDMNKVAAQSLLLGAQLLGLENVVVVKGDDFTERELSSVKDVNDFRPTELIASIAKMNEGVDFRGSNLRAPTDFCIGATIDLNRDTRRELALTRRKAEAGAQFFMAQPTYDPQVPRRFLERYAERYGEELSPPVFHGMQVMVKDSIMFGDVPQWVKDGLESGRPGPDIALELLQSFTNAGFRTIYLVPPILRGGRRDYEAAQAVLEAFRSHS